MEMSSELELKNNSFNTTRNGNLLLLEIYLHNIEFKALPSCEDDKNEFLVTFKILDNIHFDLLSSSGLIDNRTVKFKNGKSCLFYVPGDYPIEEDGLSVGLEVWQKLSCPCLPSKFLIGTGKVQIMDKFIKCFDDDNESFPGKSTVEQYSCFNAKNEEVLGLIMTLTVTNLGQNLISQYRFLPDKSNTHISNSPKYEIKKMENVESPAFWKMTHQVSDEKYCPCPKKSSPVARSTKGSLSQLVTGIYEKNDNYFEEIGTVLNSNEIKIRIPKRKSKYSYQMLANNANGQNRLLDTKYYKPTENKIFLNMSEDFSKIEEDLSPFSTQVAYANDKEQILTISPNHTPPGVEALKVKHPNKDVFLLRLKKKSKLSADNKVNLELEFITPKGPSKSVTPRLETRETQYDEKDLINEISSATARDVFDKSSQEKVTVKRKVKKHKGKKSKNKNKKAKRL